MASEELHLKPGFLDSDLKFVADLEKKKHPLIDPQSRHYEILGDESIELLEKMFSPKDIQTWAKITAMQYRLRIGKKNLHGDKQKAVMSDISKIENYENYYFYLKEIYDL